MSAYNIEYLIREREEERKNEGRQEITITRMKSMCGMSMTYTY